MQLLAGLILALAIAFIAYKAGSLSRSGAWAAAGLGTVIFGLGGLGWSALLLAFFISSSGLSRLAEKSKRSLTEKFSKGHRRDAGQVLANGGIAGLLTLLHLLDPQAVWPWVGAAGALAAANADTWATELGVLSSTSPRLITTRQPVERGTSGGITLTGLLAALLGALLIGLVAAAFWPGGMATPAVFAGRTGLIVLAGLLGSLLDSWLGATIQAIYYCPTCRKETERHPLHTCGTTTTHLRGLTWLDNDGVNTACTITGALAAVLMVFV